MKGIIQHPIYGEIVYTENFWTGKKSLMINGVDAQRVSKNEFMVDGKNAKITGNYFAGNSMEIEGEIVPLIPKTKWYERVLALIPLIFLMTWGNSVELCSIFPVVGGVTGGALGGLAACVSLSLMKKTKSVAIKGLYGVGVCVVTILIAYVMALVIILATA